MQGARLLKELKDDRSTMTIVKAHKTFSGETTAFESLMERYIITKSSYTRVTHGCLDGVDAPGIWGYEYSAAS